MFEKEAEKSFEKIAYIGNTKLPNGINKVSYLKGFQDGSEFGYNKANEWHYVKDGDLPKETGEYLVYRISGYGSKSIDLIQYNNSKHFWCVDCQNEVIAWKEIVLPKESE